MIEKLIPTKLFKGKNILEKNEKELNIEKKAMIKTEKTTGKK